MTIRLTRSSRYESHQFYESHGGFTDWKERPTWRFRPETQQKTQDCVDLLRRTTTEEELLKTAGGNKWIVRRAIEMYKLDLDIAGYATYKSVEVDTSSMGSFYKVKA